MCGLLPGYTRFGAEVKLKLLRGPLCRSPAESPVVVQRTPYLDGFTGNLGLIAEERLHGFWRVVIV